MSVVHPPGATRDDQNPQTPPANMKSPVVQYFNQSPESPGSQPLGSTPIFWPALRDHPPPVPPQLLRKLACTDTCSVGKVKVLLRVSSAVETPESSKVLEVDSRKKTVTLFDPGSIASSPTPTQEHSRVGIAAPKMFAFDGIFMQEDSQTEVCSAALSDVIVAVLRGVDGAVFSFGQANLGQTYTMLGTPTSTHSLGVIPSALCWLYRALEERRTHTGSRFSVRVSALQVTAGDDVTDLLTQFASDDQPPGVFLMEQDPGNAAILPKACEIRAPNAEKAAHLLDAALSNRHIDAHGRAAHFVFTFNIYQYSVDTSAKGGVAGGRSRLHFLDFGSLDRGKGSSRLSVSALGNVLLAIFNGQKHLPYKDSRLPRLVRECVGSVRCITSLLVHVSAASAHFQETLSTIQLASRVHRLRRRRIKAHIGGSGSGGSSEESRSGKSSRGTITEAGSSSVDPSSSEQSCDTVIYVGPGADEATDGEHPPVYLPSINSGDNRCSMKKVLRGSSVDSKANKKGTLKSPVSSSSKNPKSPKHSSSPKELSSPQRTKDPSAKSKDYVSNSVVSAVNGHCGANDAVSGKNVNGVSGGSLTRTSAKHLPSNIANKLCSGAIPKSPKSPHVSRHKSHKNPPANSAPQDPSAAPEPSDEQWIDGPRVSKAKILEGHKVKGCELETWIDGPEATYGYMDDHKKSMIQKWVETQNVNVPKSNSTTPTKSPKQTTHFKELTQFKTVEDEELSPKHKEKVLKEKRRSSDCREGKKDPKTHAKEKDSPHRRKSYTDKPPHPQPNNESGATSRPKSQVNASNSTPSKSTYYSKDNPIVGSPPVNATSGPLEQQSLINNKLQRSNSITHGATEESPSKHSLVNSAQNRPLKAECATAADQIGAAQKHAPQSNDNKHLNGEQSEPSVRVSNDGPSKGREEAEIKVINIRQEEALIENRIPAEKEEVLQIIYIQKEEGYVDTKIQQELSQDIYQESVLASPSEDGTNSSVAGDEGEAVEVPADDNASQASSDDSQSEAILEDEILKDGSRRIILREVPFDLDGLDEEAEEELNLSLDRWLADEEREYIEVTESEEPVEMVDSWVQVTEEDLERTMAEAGLSFVPFLPHRHILPTLEEEPSETPLEEPEIPPAKITVSAQSYIDNPLTQEILKSKSSFEPGDFRGSSRYERMISDPNFTAKTHYFAKRLEELRQLHEVYRNLAKQAPRGRNSIHSSSILLPQLSEDDDYILEGSSISESLDEMDTSVTNSPFHNPDSALSSLKFNGNFDFDWKSLLPEELDLQSDFGDAKNEDESASEISKDGVDPLYDIQSDIMPYLPSNYVNLTNLSSNTTPVVPPTETKMSIEIPVAVEQLPNNLVEIITETQTYVNPPTCERNGGERIPQVTKASLSDDENNVKQVKVKKEKRKKKLGILSKSSKTSAKKGDVEVDQASISSKLSWSRFFGSPKQRSSSKESPKKVKTSSKSSSKSNIIVKSPAKSEKKIHKEKEKVKDTRTSNSKDEKQTKDSKNNTPEHEPAKAGEKKYHQKVEADRHVSSPKSSKSPSRRSSESRSGSNSSSRSQRRNETTNAKAQQQNLITQQHPEATSKSINGRYQQGFQWESFQPVTTTSIHGYDSGTDSGVGLKVTPRGKRSRGDSRHGESSGYESVIRDSECSSFGSSQDSGLDDEGQKGKLDSKGKLIKTICVNQIEQVSSNKSHHNCSQVIKEENQNELNGISATEVQLTSIRLPDVEEFDEEDVARYENHTTEEDIAKCRRTQEKIRALREKQDELKKELEAAKGRLTIDKSRWSFELHVEECMTFRDEGFLEALTQETLILSKRVVAARSRILIATSFDIASPGDVTTRGHVTTGFENHRGGSCGIYEDVRERNSSS